MGSETPWVDVGWNPPDDAEDIGRWAADDADLIRSTTPPHELLDDQPCMRACCKSQLHHAQVTVTEHETRPSQVADLLLMLGLVPEDRLKVDPLTAYNPDQRKHK